MALTIATGFVVDDAIVVLENIVAPHRGRHAAARRRRSQGAREVGFTVLSMSLSLIAVFIPILLMGGIVGRLFREFAVTLSVAILVSLRGLADHHADDVRAPAASPREREPRPAVRADRARASTAMLRGYERTLALGAAPSGAGRAARCSRRSALNVYLYIIVPKGFFPQQDTGRLIGFIQADQSISFQAMQQKLAAVRRRSCGATRRSRTSSASPAAGSATRGSHVRRAEAARPSATSPPSR